MPGGAAVPRNALLEELEEHPERFSPNVIMRPLYQEFILPNCAYVGGGGELAYWFQLKGVFDHFRVPFPALVLRTSLMVLDEKAAKLQARLDLSDEQLFQPTDGLKAELASAHSEVDTSLSNERDRIADVFSDAIDRAVAVNEGLERAFRAVAHKTDDQLGSLEKKLLRHSKRKQSELMSRVDRLFERIFPAGGLQERSEGYFLLRATIGPDWRDALIEALDPLHPEFTVVSVGHDG